MHETEGLRQPSAGQLPPLSYVRPTAQLTCTYSLRSTPFSPFPDIDRFMVSRREVLAALASTAALPFLSACAGEGTPDSGSNEPTALTLLNQCAEDLLTLFPESATSLGIDTGNRAGLRAQLADRSESGKQRIAEQVRAGLARVNAFDATGLSHKTRTSIEVVKSAYATALEGLALP
jgi:hypothetical protein